MRAENMSNTPGATTNSPLARTLFSLVSWVMAVDDVMMALQRDGSLAHVADRLASFEQRQQAVGKPHYDAPRRRYRWTRSSAP